MMLHPVITRVCGTADANQGTRRPLTLALRAIQPSKGRWITRGRAAPIAREERRMSGNRVEGTHWTKSHTRFFRFLKAVCR